MQEFNEGDLVEAVKGESVVRGRVKIGNRDNGTEGYKYLGDSGAIKEVYIHDGWTVTVIEKAAPKLPTEPGSVLRGTETNRAILMRRYPINGRDPEGPWVSVSGVTYSDAEAVRFFRGQFVILEPVPVTAKKVLDAIRQRIGSIDSAYDFQAVAATFGVSE